MIRDPKLIDKYYNLLIEKDSSYAGIFFVGVKTTGIFCRPTCPAKKPKKENCDFFTEAQEAVLAGFRPCKRCHPLEVPSLFSPEVKKLVAAIEADPQKHWRERDFDELAITSNTARRQFKKQFGMTFIEYARARRLGLAFNNIRNGKKMIDVQLEAGFDSSNGFRDAFTRTMGALPTKNQEIKTLESVWIETKLGPMLGISDSDSLYLLEFVDRRGLETELDKLRRKGYAIIPGRNSLLTRLEQELTAYFNGTLTEFTIPLATTIGTPFQRSVWLELGKIPFGQTISYKELACKIGNPNASRAVARANGSNQMALLIPCHRVIGSNGELTGYAGGLERKQWLINLEKNSD